MSKPILIIDDEKKFACMLQELLQLNGYESDYCLDPKEAVVRLRKEDFDLVISDYKMPGMDGAEFLTEARKINPDLPVVMISGLMNLPELIKVANIGVTLVLEKPFKTEELMEQVARFVRTHPDDASTAEAMDMEASEMNFQQGQAEVTYPSPARFISDASNENKRFLEVIWKNANACRHIPFFAQHGAEVRLVAQEVMGWSHQEVSEDVVRIDLIDTKTDFTRSWVLECESFPEVLLIDIRGCTWDSEAAAILSDWISFVETCGKDLSLSRLLYVLPTGAGFNPAALDIPESSGQLMAEEFPVLLSLRERIPDTATYIRRFLTPKEKLIAGIENLKRLIQYSWPGGYRELKARLEDLRSHIDVQQAMSTKDLDLILAAQAEDAASLNGPPGLEGYLKRRQREYITLHRKAGEDLKETLLRLGIHADEADPDAILKDEMLVYPDILNESSQ